ncbi:MAG: hypothetical protein LBT23_01940 [Synergistaceae bacterium]|jgi:hypothetical protein|nr:hypothetical protein [Synergistaceae bacterium]
MRPGSKREELEFVGARPKNQSIVSRIRDHGYIGVMLNKEDFLDAVVWAANVVYEYKDFFNSRHRSSRILLSVDELPFLKQDVVSAHFIMIFYYNMKQNYVLIEQFKQSLYTVARFQKIAPEDSELMKKVDERLAKLSAQEENEFNFNTEPELKGAEKQYNYYSALVTKEIERHRDECLKAKV